jgi:hypothetical protein
LCDNQKRAKRKGGDPIPNTHYNIHTIPRVISNKNITFQLPKKQKLMGMQTVKESLQIQDGIFSSQEQVERQPEKIRKVCLYHENVYTNLVSVFKPIANFFYFFRERERE